MLKGLLVLVEDKKDVANSYFLEHICMNLWNVSIETHFGAISLPVSQNPVITVSPHCCFTSVLDMNEFKSCLFLPHFNCKVHSTVDCRNLCCSFFLSWVRWGQCLHQAAGLCHFHSHLNNSARLKSYAVISCKSWEKLTFYVGTYPEPLPHPLWSRIPPPKFWDLISTLGRGVTGVKVHTLCIVYCANSATTFNLMQTTCPHTFDVHM